MPRTRSLKWSELKIGIMAVAALLIAAALILALGGLMNAGFDQIFNLYSPLVYRTGDIIDTLVYRTGILNNQYGVATAVGLLKSLVSLVLIAIAYKLADKWAGYRIF